MSKRRPIKNVRNAYREANPVKEGAKFSSSEALKYAQEAKETPFDEAELMQIDMYRRAIKNAKFAADTKCWNCDKMYYGDSCPYCGTFKPRDVTK